MISYRHRQSGDAWSHPIFVHIKRRIHYASDGLSDDVIESREYSDSYGRLIQSRAQAEEHIFGADGDEIGLPLLPGGPTLPAAAVTADDRVVVSSWQVFDNKGKVVEKYEPFFSLKWDFQPESEAKKGKHATLFYDPRGRIARALNPDGSERRIIFGKPSNPVALDMARSEPCDLDLLIRAVSTVMGPTNSTGFQLIRRRH